jgi:hypothetical protein
MVAGEVWYLVIVLCVFGGFMGALAIVSWGDGN